jgi:two-component system OmpR family response regulator
MSAAARVGIVSRGEAGHALGEALLPHGFRVLRHDSAGAALAACGDAALLAVDATGAAHEAFDGIRLLRARGYRGDVLALVDRDDSLSAVLALEMGADAFLEVPVHPRVAGAYARRVVRGHHESARLRAGSLEVHLAARTASVAGTVVRLPDSEFDLLACLARRTGEPVSRRELLAACGEAGSLGARAVDSRICRLRARLGEVGGPQVVTLRGRGYMLSVEARAS